MYSKSDTKKMCATDENAENKEINMWYARTPPHGPGLLERSKASVKKNPTESDRSPAKTDANTKHGNNSDMAE